MSHPRSDGLELANIQTNLQADLDKFQKLSQLSSANSHDVESVLQSIDSLEESTSSLYRLRATKSSNDPVRQNMEYLIGTTARVFLTFQTSSKKNEITFIHKYRKVWRENFSLFLYTLNIFIVSCLLGWNLGVNGGDYTLTLIPQQLAEKVVDHTAWFEEIRENPIRHGYSIAVNNIKVSINAFLGGALLGLGSLYILLFNGIFIGCLMGFCYINGFHESLTRFILGHGPIELTIIVAAAFAGFIFARQFYQFGPGLSQRLAASAGQAGILMLGILPWLIVAACLEVFISPFETFSPTQKMFLGLLVAALFWLWTFGGKKGQVD